MPAFPFALGEACALLHATGRAHGVSLLRLAAVPLRSLS